MFIVNILTLAVFGGAYLLAQRFGIDWLKVVPGTLLLYYLPGHNLNTILFSRRKMTEWYVRLPLDIILSVCSLSIVYLIFRSSLGLSGNKLVFMVLVTNIILTILAFYYDRSSIKVVFSSLINILQNKPLLLIFFAPIILFIIRVVLNPYIYDIDSLHYFTSYQNITNTGIDSSSLYIGREAFPFVMASSHFVAGWNYIGFFKVFTPVIFYITSIISLSLLNKGKNLLAHLSVLVIFSSPMLIIMNETVRPETLNIALTIPALTLAYLGIKNNDKVYTLLAIIISVVAFKFHEIGLILLACSMLALLIHIILNIKNLKKLIIKHWKLLLFVTPPYILLIRAYPQSMAIFTQSGMSSNFLKFVSERLEYITWKWWFLDNATTVVGAKIGWPGYSAIYYYLYHGIIIFTLTIVLLIILMLLKKTRGNKINFLAISPLLIFFFIHFSIAEILPRVGIVLLFDRSWPYISMIMAIFSIIMIEKIVRHKDYNSVKRIVSVAIYITVVSGMVGATVASTWMGGMVSPYEKKAIQAIKSLPEDSIILSTQRNQNLVQIYGNKAFYQIESNYSTTNNFTREAMDNVINLTRLQREAIIKTIVINKTSKNTIEYNNTVTQSNEVFLENVNGGVIEDPDQKLMILQQYYPKSFDPINQRLELIKTLPTKNMYFLYSFAKLDHGILNSRPWWQESSDVKNYQLFKDYNIETNIEAKDNNFILIKVN